ARSSNVFRCGRQDVAVPLGFAVLSVLWWLPPGGVAEHHHLLFLQHTGDRSSRPATPATTPRSLPHKEKHPGSPGRPVGGVARAAPGVAGGGRGGPSEAAVFAGTDAKAAPLPLSTVPVCRPHVYRAKLNTTVFLAGNPVKFPTSGLPGSMCGLVQGDFAPGIEARRLRLSTGWILSISMGTSRTERSCLRSATM